MWVERCIKPRRCTSARVWRPMTSSRSFTTSKISSVIVGGGFGCESLGQSRELPQTHFFRANLHREAELPVFLEEQFFGPILREQFQHHLAALRKSSLHDFVECL